MAVYSEGPKTLIAAGTIGRYERVKVDAAGKWAQAGVNEKAHGIADKSVVAGESLSAALLNCACTLKMKASGVIAVGVKVYAAAAGKIGTTGTSCLEGMSLGAATADGDIIEVLAMNTSLVSL